MMQLKLKNHSFKVLQFSIQISLLYSAGKYGDRFAQRQLIENRHQNGLLYSIQQDDFVITGQWLCH